MKMTYTIFDSHPGSSGPCSWPSHSGVEIRARDAQGAEKRVRKIARAEGRTCGAYRPEDRLWYLIWNGDGMIVADGYVSLGGPGLPACDWRNPDKD